MKNRFRSLSAYSLNAVGVLATLFLFVKGADWGAEHLLHPLEVIGEVVVAFDVMILLPLSFAGPLRPLTGTLIYLSSYLLGLVTWLYGFVVTYTLWGGLAVVIGLVFFGVGVVLTAMLACIVKTQWVALIAIIALAMMTLGSRLAGPVIRSAAPAPDLDTERVSVR